MNRICDLISRQRLWFDGGTGTVLQEMGLPAGTPPEIWNLTHPEKITALHRAYLDAGCNIIKTNTFGIHADKYPNYRELITAAMKCARDAVNGRENVFVAFDIGPSGRLMEPYGDLAFEEAVELFGANVRLAAENGADLILIETMNDCYETKAAVLAAKENCDLPVFVTNVYDAYGKLMTGATPEAMIAMLEGMGVDALGMNCSLGPEQMLGILEHFTEAASVPIIVNPNAGLPEVVDGKTVFSVGAEKFSDLMVQMAERGACILGGCCGTQPEYIRRTIEKTAEIPYTVPTKKHRTVVSSYTHACMVSDTPILIGERINPTGKPKLKDALRRGDTAYLIGEGVRQAEAGVHILDVNVGLPEIDEAAVMEQLVPALQAVTDLPLQLDSNNPAVLARAMRVYNGKPLVNSVNGDEESMRAVFPLVKKYGGTVIALTMDKSGIPATAAERVAVAERIISVAAEYGIALEDVIIDPLALTVSSDTGSALVTLEALRLLREKGIRTSLGVSNISFGLPKREKINSAFYAAALENGLNCAIMNPFAPGMMDVFYAYCVLHGFDSGCASYIAYADATESAVPVTAATADDMDALKHAVLRGMKEEAAAAAAKRLTDTQPLALIDTQIIPALNEIGTAFEEKRAYLPQLLMSAEAASAAFDVIRGYMPKNDENSGRAVILATVKGDIHDIGKNIVRVLLESYGFIVHDLGRDTDPDAVLAAVRETGCKFVGLSALMTTTVPAMAETIELLHREENGVFVVVGGAVLNADYAEMIHADLYCADAMETVRAAEHYYSCVENN